MTGAVSAIAGSAAASAVAGGAAIDAGTALAGGSLASAVGAAALPSLSTIATGATLAGAGVSAIGSIASGQAQQAAAGYNASVAKQNATIATQNAATAGAVGEENAGIQGLKNKAAVGGILAAQGANGVDVNSGSAVSVRAGQEEAGQLSAQTIRSNAARQAYGFQTNAASDTGQAAEDTFAGKQAALSGDIGAGTDLLKGAGSAAMFSGLGGNPPTAAQNWTAQQASNGATLPTQDWDFG